jgi:hypothetical protein
LFLGELREGAALSGRRHRGRRCVIRVGGKHTCEGSGEAVS